MNKLNDSLRSEIGSHNVVQAVLSWNSLCSLGQPQITSEPPSLGFCVLASEW